MLVSLAKKTYTGNIKRKTKKYKYKEIDQLQHKFLYIFFTSQKNKFLHTKKKNMKNIQKIEKKEPKTSTVNATFFGQVSK